MTDANLFFFNDTATTEIYTLSLHDALPILVGVARFAHPEQQHRIPIEARAGGLQERERDRKSTRLNSSHRYLSYAVFCFKKKDSPDLLPARLLLTTTLSYSGIQR